MQRFVIGILLQFMLVDSIHASSFSHFFVDRRINVLGWPISCFQAGGFRLLHCVTVEYPA
ncbi:MAG: hypothetical protein B6D71_16300 [gamma proteobacterium symbiont of Stewartia floridana]|nr:MAG: hypothetical protein B6D71_16300 [gamma proteobacterium symbiont of Stewartia floridana]